MLVLTRKKGQRINIGDDITITILDIKPDGIKIGIDAPKDVSILRNELIEDVKGENLEAAKISINELKSLEYFLKKS